MRIVRPVPKTLSLLISAIVAGGAAVPAANAQEGGFGLEEIVVTARKKEESLQETPIAVSAFSGESLARTGILNVADFNRNVPGMEVQAGNGVAGVANIYIRGVGQRNTEPNLDSGVGIYLDGVYIGRSDGALLDMNDVGSVQVLRGPQGTLFGKNTTGGAMLIETNRPSEELEGKVSVTVGNYDQLDGAVVVNLPLIDDTLYTRLSLMSVDRDGYVESKTIGGQDYNDADRVNGIWQLRWTPSEELTADLNLNYAKTSQRPRGLQCNPSSTNFGNGWLSILNNGAFTRAFGGRTLEDFCLDSAKTDKYETVQDLGGGYDSKNKGASLTLNWDIAEGMALKSISAWRNTVAAQDDDLDPLSIAYQHRTNSLHPFAQDRDTDQYSQEFDFTGEAMDGFVSYIAGLYYFKEETTNSRTVGITGDPWSVVKGIPGALFGFPPGTPVDLLYYNVNATDLFTENESWAAFLQADWSLSERWKLTTGIRYTDETRELTRNSWLVDRGSLSTSGKVVPGPASALPPWAPPVPPPPADPLCASSATWWVPQNTFDPNHGFRLCDVDSDDTDADAWTPLVSLSYLIEDWGFIETGSAYLTVSKGFRSGGLSEAPSANLEEFDPEEVVSTEIGLKMDALERRLRVNAAIFDLAYDDRQLTTIVVSPQGRIAGATINAKESSVRGAEVETTFLPIDNLELTLNTAWYDGEIEEWEDTQLAYTTTPSIPAGCVLTSTGNAAGVVYSCEIDRSDENLPRLPDRTVLLAAQYFLQTSVGTFVPRVAWSKKYEIDSCFDRISCTSGDFLNDHEDLSARLSWMGTDEHWSASAYVNNITEEDYVIGGQPLYDAWGFGGYVYAPPRMYGAELTYRW